MLCDVATFNVLGLSPSVLVLGNAAKVLRCLEMHNLKQHHCTLKTLGFNKKTAHYVVLWARLCVKPALKLGVL